MLDDQPPSSPYPAATASSGRWKREQAFAHAHHVDGIALKIWCLGPLVPGVTLQASGVNYRNRAPLGCSREKTFLVSSLTCDEQP